MIRRCIFLFVICLGSSVSFAEDWIMLAATDEITWEGRSKSMEFTQTKGGKKIVVAAGRVFDKKAKSYTFEKWYVANEDCSLGYGKLVTLDMQGNYKYETDFVQKGGTIATKLADMLCTPILQNIKEIESKGI